MSNDTIHLGYEVGTGNAVSIPVRHLAVTGQTQESGKTTTLEALVSRSGLTALAFVTKRGEKSFTEGRRIQPYFRDRADWQFVTSIIDATLQEKNKFLRPWIMKICRSTRTLAEVQTKVRDALKTAKGINEGVYTQLDAYLELIVPEIRRAKLSPTLDLRRGLNVMDVGAFATPMQMLFVQSALDWVNEHAENTVVVVPEAWEFIPEGKGSPAKASAVALVRKGAGLGNRIWVDSQDMAGVDKVILRGCAVWLIGVQREANEIKRNLSNIPASIKRPSAAAVAQLERGQFYACWGTHAVKTYVQPAWMDAHEAEAHAIGAPVAPSRRATPPKAAPLPIEPVEDDTVNEAEAQRLRDENDELRARIAELEESVKKYVGVFNGPDVVNAAPVNASPTLDTNALYESFRARLLKEPAVLRVLGLKPEIQVTRTRETIEVDESKWVGRVAGLIAEGFFDEPRKAGAVFKEAARRGMPGVAPRADEACKKLWDMGFLTREEEGFVAVPGMKVNIVER